MANQWLTGTGVPSTSVGQVTDYYRDTANNLVYYRENAFTWTVVPAFTPNPDGIGTTWLHGNVPPLTGQGSDGDYYYDEVQLIVYRKDGATWVPKGSLDFIGIYGVQWGNGLGAPANIPSLNNLPAGSFYLDVATSDIYYKNPSLVWGAKGQLGLGSTGLDAIATAADRVQTGLDRVATAADRVQTGLDRVATAADRVQTGLDRVATAADSVATAADRVQTGLDRVQTGADVITTASARDAALLSRGVFATTAKALSNGVINYSSLVAGTSGTDGTFAISFSGGAGTGAAGYFTVASGSITSITFTATGDSYTSAPTMSFSASSGLTGASATAVIGANVNSGEYFSVVASDSNEYLMLYLNDSGTAVEQKRYPSVEAIALSGYEQSGYIWAQVDSNYNLIFGVDSDGLFQKFKVDSINFNGQIMDYLSATEYQQCGYKTAVVGTNYAILEAVDDNGVLVVSNIYVASPSNTTSDNFNGQAVTYESSTEYQQSGYIEAEIDSSYRLIVGVTNETYPKQAGAPACLETNANKWVDVDSSYAVYSAHNSSNLKQLYRYSKAAGTTTALTSKFNNVEPVLAGSNIVFTSDRPEPFPTKNMWWCPVTNSTGDAGVNPVFPKRYLVNYSDSIYAGTGASDADHGVTALVAASLGLSYTNNGIGGQTSQQVAQRFGALTTGLTITGNQIPTSGAVTVTHINNVALAGMNTTQFPDYRLLSTQADNNTRSLVGTLGSVYGTLTRSSSGGLPSTTETYTFTRAKAGSVVNIAANETFTVDVGDLDKCVLNIEVGANDVGQNIGSYATAITAVTTNIAAMVARCRTLHLAYVVVGFPSTASAAYYTGTALATALTAWRVSMAATYGDRWYDTMPVMLANGDGSPTDNADIANGIPPTSLRADTIHWNDSGHAVNATATAAKFTPQLTF